MTSLMTLDCEHLAAVELERADLCSTEDSRTRHLNRAALYAHHAELAASGPAQPKAVLNLIGSLSAALDEADSLSLTGAALHINQAIVELGGIGTSPPEAEHAH